MLRCKREFKFDVKPDILLMIFVLFKMQWQIWLKFHLKFEINVNVGTPDLNPGLQDIEGTIESTELWLPKTICIF